VKAAESPCPIAEVSGSKWSLSCSCCVRISAVYEDTARSILSYSSAPTYGSGEVGLAITEEAAAAEVAREIGRARRE